MPCRFVSHPFSGQRSIHLSDLRKDHFVLFPEGYVLRQIAVDACKQAGYEPTISSEGEDLDAIKGLVSAGMGVTLLPESAFYETTPRFTAKIPIDFPQVRRTVGIIASKSREMSPSAHDFYVFVKDFFSKIEQYK